MLFLSSDLAGRRRHRRPGQLDSARMSGRRAQNAPPLPAGALGPFCHHTRARPGDSIPHPSPPRPSCFPGSAGDVENPALPATPRHRRPPRQVPRPGALRALRTRATPRGHTFAAEEQPPRATRRGDWEPSRTPRPGRPGEGAGGGGTGAQGVRLGYTPDPQAAYSTTGAAGGGEGSRVRGEVQGTRRSGRRPWPEARVGATDAQRRRSGSARPLVLTCRASVPPPVAASLSESGAVVVHGAGGVEGCGQQLHEGPAARPALGPGRERGAPAGPRTTNGLRSGVRTRSTPAGAPPPPPPPESAPAGGRAGRAPAGSSRVAAAAGNREGARGGAEPGGSRAGAWTRRGRALKPRLHDRDLRRIRASLLGRRPCPAEGAEADRGGQRAESPVASAASSTSQTSPEGPRGGLEGRGGDLCPVRPRTPATHTHPLRVPRCRDRPGDPRLCSPDQPRRTSRASAATQTMRRASSEASHGGVWLPPGYPERARSGPGMGTGRREEKETKYPQPSSQFPCPLPH